MTKDRRKAQVPRKNELRLLPKCKSSLASDSGGTLHTQDGVLTSRQRPSLSIALPRGSQLKTFQRSRTDHNSDLSNHDASAGRDALEFVKYSLEPFSDRLDPFAQLPVVLDRFQEHLVSFYLLYYPKVTYGLSAQLKPHPVATNFSIAVNNPPNFQIALARSALYRISLQKYANESEKHDLEVAVLTHKVEAIRMVKEMSLEPDATCDKEKLIASIISLGTLDNRTGAKDTASMHFMAVRRLLRSIGGPLGIKSALLSRVMVHFECIYGSVSGSYIWDRSDTSRLLADTNRFFASVWDLWKSLGSRNSITSTTDATKSTAGKTSIPSKPGISVEAFTLRPSSSLHEALSRPVKSDSPEITPQDKMKLTFQLTCLLTYSHIILDHATDPDQLEAYLLNINGIIDDAQLTDQPCNNHMWLLQVHDQSSTHDGRIWRAAGLVWLLRHVPYNVQKDIRDWLLAFCTGQSSTGRSVKKLDTFYFSYAAQTT
ncbi:hypothetical protein OHC33_000749 [Knufia fluminis]|uniref:Tachykinin family protein n=1 Tax=Knufia fluminis TaxID=191047 RepID=A0AAN8EM04_9EURO|nr:hypothetical protein OHC33_000749 [Knufia fluminis]